MPNIEIHGFERDEALKIRERIWEVASGFKRRSFLDFLDEAVVTIFLFQSETRSAQDRLSPFVRVFFEHDLEQEMVNKVLAKVAELQGRSFDAEFVRVAHFCSYLAKTV